MNTTELYEKAKTPNISTKEFMSFAEEFMKLSAYEDGETEPREVVTALWMADRYDILDEIKDHPVYGEDAKNEISTKNMMDKLKNQRELELSEYPEIFKEMNAVLKATSRIGYYDIMYPSRHAMFCGLGSNNFAVSGDGLFLYMFEVVSLEGRGLFKLMPRPKNPHDPPSNGGDTYSNEFIEIGGWKLGDVISGDDVLATFKKVYPAHPPRLRCEEVDPGSSGTYDWVKAMVDGDSVRLRYRCTDLTIDGSDGFDDDLEGWTEKDIREYAGGMLGIVKEDRHLIEIEYA
jgi:hypothetical protein